MPKTLVVPTVFTAVDKMSGVVDKMAGSIKNFAKTNPTMKFFGSVRDGANSIFDKIVSLKTAVAGLALVAGAKQLYDQVLGVAELGDEIDKTSKLIGIGSTALQELQFAAMRENVSNETLVNSLQKLNKNVGDLKIGSGSLHTVLKATNPTLEKQLRNVKSNEEAFNLIVKAVNKAPNVFKKAQLAQAAFGKSGQDMLKLIDLGPEGIAKLRKEAQKLGIVLDEGAIAKAAEFADASDNMNSAITGLKNNIGVGLMPVVQRIVEKITKWATENRELIKAKLAEFADKFAKGLQWIADNFDKIVKGAKLFLKTLLALKILSISTTGVMWGIAAATVAYNIAIGLAGALTGTANIAIGKSPVALAAYEIAMWASATATAAWAAAMNLGLWPLLLIALAIAALIAIIYTVVKHTKGWGEQWDEVMRFMKAVFEAWVGVILLHFQGLNIAFWAVANTLVTAWQWAQNKMGNISDEQFAKNKAAMKGEQDARIQAMMETARKTSAAAATVSKGMEWKLAWKTPEDIKAEEAAAVTPAVNPMGERQAAMNQTTTKNNNSNVTVDFKNLPFGAQIMQGANGNPAMPVNTSTMIFGGG